MSEDLKLSILNKLAADGSIADTKTAFANVSSETILGALKSLESQEKVTYETITSEVWSIEPEGQDQLKNGSYEARIYDAVPAGEQGISIADLNAKFGKMANLGMGKGFQNKWIKKNGANVVRLVDSIVDQVKADLQTIVATNGNPSAEVIKNLKKRA
ncbi:Phenylalanyl-tRNA synthetase, beta subunit, cytoplasmic, partial [Coemansia sp. RSA 486]